MKNYVFYLEPYVLLDICKDSAILINTLDNKKLLFEDSEIVRILSPFLDLKSAILKFSDADITPAFETLLSQIKEAYMGDYFEINPESNLPFQYPLFNAYKELMKNRLFQKHDPAPLGPGDWKSLFLREISLDELLGLDRELLESDRSVVCRCNACECHDCHEE